MTRERQVTAGAPAVEPAVTLDPERLRRGTPAADGAVHLNNASASLMPSSVTGAMAAYLADEAALGQHRAAERNDAALAGMPARVARLLGAREPVAFFDTVSRAMALLLGALPWRAGDRLLLGRHEWGALHAAAATLARSTGVTVETVPCADDTTVDLGALAARLDDRVRAVCLPLHTAAGGRPTLAVALPRPPGCLVFGDAAQAIGQLPFDLERSGYDVVVGTGRKWLRGPVGIAFAGFSRAGRALLDDARWLGGRPDETTVISDHSRLLRTGLGAAVDLALECGIDALHDRVLALARRLHAGLLDVPGVAPLDPEPASGIVAVSAGGREAELAAALAGAGIRVALVQAKYHPGLFEQRGLERAVRFSAHAFNTEDEIDRTLGAVTAALRAGA